MLALGVGYLIAQRRTRRHTMRFANLELLEKVAPRRPGRWRHLPTALVLVGLFLLTVALAGPTADTKEPRNRATVMLAIDVSLSMEATDVAPNRLAAAQEAATQFVDDLTPGVNLGIVSFAGIATVLVSPTTDRTVAKQAIAGLKLDERTATGEAIISSLQTIELFSKIAARTRRRRRPGRAAGPDRADDRRQTHRRADRAGRRAAGGRRQGAGLGDRVRHRQRLDHGQRRDDPGAAGHRGDAADRARSPAATSTPPPPPRSSSRSTPQLGEQIGYEIKQQDVSRPWMIAGTVLVIIGSAAALAFTARIP